MASLAPDPSGLQHVSMSAEPSAAAANLAAAAMRGELSTVEAVEVIGEYLSGLPRVDVVVASLISLKPERGSGWINLGDRAWLRQWAREGSPCRVVPEVDSAADLALSLPWMSSAARHGVIAVSDIERLPPEAETDRQELAACNVRAILGGSQVFDGEMFGSVSVASAEPGPWPSTHVADLRLLSAVLACRMAETSAQLGLAEAIALSEQARTQQQQFFATIGHELRTPIAAIIGFSEVLADEARDEIAAEVVERDAGVILRAGEQLLAIVEDLLSTGRTLGAEEARADQDVAAAVEDVIHWHRTPARAKDVSVVSTVKPGLRVHARAAGLRQVLTNLVGNAIVHNRHGGSVEVSAEQTFAEARDARVRITVRDTGPGLEPLELERVFEPFVRYSGADVRGTGLGLSLARTVAERDGGLVGGESVPGQGSVFWVDLPAAHA